MVTGPSRPTSQPQIHLFQEARQPCPRPTAQHPLKLHRRDSCPINHPRQASTRPASAPASIVGHFLSHLQLLPSQAGPEAHPGRDHAPRGSERARCPYPGSWWAPTSTWPGHPAGHFQLHTTLPGTLIYPFHRKVRWAQGAAVPASARGPLLEGGHRLVWEPHPWLPSVVWRSVV